MSVPNPRPPRSVAVRVLFDVILDRLRQVLSRSRRRPVPLHHTATGATGTVHMPDGSQIDLTVRKTFGQGIVIVTPVGCLPGVFVHGVYVLQGVTFGFQGVVESATPFTRGEWSWQIVYRLHRLVNDPGRR